MTSTANNNTTGRRKAPSIWSIPNLMSVSRVFVAAAIIWEYQTHDHRLTWVMAGLVIYGILSDYLDGYLARRKGIVSDVGNALDPVADKISCAMLFLYSIWIGRIPIEYLWLIIIRDLIIMGVSLYIRYLTGRMPKAIMSGKVSINAVAAYWVAAFFAPDATTVIGILMWLSIALMIYSFGDYMIRYYRTYRRIKSSREISGR